MTSPKAFQHSLCCLTHPATLLSIGLLLINDHVLKVVAPSWLTGKLSDFAGLFFFPFLLSALLSWLLMRTSLSTRQIGAAAFATTAVWFISIKTTEWGNAATSNALGLVLSGPAQIIVDPSDLIALPVLWPAWRIWNRSGSDQPRQTSWLALCLAALATVATTPPPPIPTFKQVASEGTTIYARAELQYGGSSTLVTRSDDGGNSWVSVREVSANIWHDTRMPIVACVPNDSRMCYRIAQPEQVQQSDDGGQTWHVAWRLPDGRRRFMEAWLRNSCNFPCFGKSLDLGPYDLTLINYGDSYAVVVALGNEGFLIRKPSGEWQRQSFEMNGYSAASPTPLAVRSFYEMQASMVNLLLVETTAWLMLAWFMPLFMSAFGSWLIDELSRHKPVSHTASWASRPIWVMIVVLVLLFVAALILSIPFARMPFLIVIYFVTVPLFYPLILLLDIVPILLAWRRIGRVIAHQATIWRGVLICVLTSLFIFPFGYVPLLLWLWGVIGVYEIALITAIVLTATITFVAWHRLNAWWAQALARELD